MQDDLSSLKDDMLAFIEGHGLRRFIGYVSDDVQSVMADPAEHPEGWKDLVEIAKASGSSFVTMSEFVLEKEDVDFLIDRLKQVPYPDDGDIEEARLLRAYISKTGFVQVGWPYQGTMFLYELSTDWYDRYQRLVDLAEEMGGIVIDETGPNDED